MQAAGLLPLHLAFSRELLGVQRGRLRSEEPVRIEVRAGDPVGVDDGVDLLIREPQRYVLVPHLRRLLLVDHRPLVQPEAAEPRGPGRRRGEEALDVAHRGSPLTEQCIGVDVQALPVGPVETPVPAGGGARICGGVLQQDPGSGVPPVQVAGFEGVVGPQEVLHGVCLAPGSTFPVPRRQRPCPRLVRALAFAPVGFPQHLHARNSSPRRDRGDGGPLPPGRCR